MVYIFLGYYDNVPLYQEMRNELDNLGNYIAIAVMAIRRIEENTQKIIQFQGRIKQEDTLKEQIERVIAKVVQFAGQSTRSNQMALYLLDDRRENFVLQEPSYGYVRKDKEIIISSATQLKDVFERVEQIGYEVYTYPLILGSNLIGAIYGRKQPGEIYTFQDSEVIQMYGDYFLTSYENIQLVYSERAMRSDLEDLLQLQQKLIE